MWSKMDLIIRISLNQKSLTFMKVERETWSVRWNDLERIYSFKSDCVFRVEYENFQ